MDQTLNPRPADDRTQETHHLLKTAAPEQKTKLLLDLMRFHPEGLLILSLPQSVALASGADLEGIVFQGANLGRAQLAGTILRRSDLSNTHLDGADLSACDLAGAVLNGSTLREANLQRAMLEDASLENANLRFADLREATLDNAKLKGSDLWGATLDDAVLQNADLENAFLNDARLQRADLTGACLRNTRLAMTDFSHSELREADLRGAQMKGANLRFSSLVETNLEGLNLTGCDLTHVKLARAWLDKTRLRPEQLGGALGEELAGDFVGAEQGYLALEKNFTGLGDTEASSWAYRKRRRMEKRSAFAQGRAEWSAGGYGASAQWLARSATNQIVEWICDYGESVPRVLASLAFVYLAFVVLYWITGSIGAVYQTPAGSVSTKADFADLAIFSLLAMTGSGNQTIGVSPAGSVLLGIESFLGIAFTGLLGFVAGNRIRR